jgi:hypothetical protein
VKKVTLFLMSLCVATVSVRAEDKDFGLGIIAGEPTGVSAKLWVASRTAFDLGVAWSFRHSGFFHLHADYLWHFPGEFESAERLTLYAGIGGRFGARRDDALLGVRIVGGLAFWPRNAPIDVFVEVAPVMDLVPATELTANGGIGIRFFFK